MADPSVRRAAAPAQDGGLSAERAESAAGCAESRRPGADVVAPEARRELDRIRRRWSELPLARAADAAPLVRALLADLVPRTVPNAMAGGAEDRVDRSPVVPPADLGPGVVVDQLTVLVWDAYAGGRTDDIAERLTTLRRSLP